MKEQEFKKRIQCGIAYCEDIAINEIKQDFKIHEEKRKQIEDIALLLQNYSKIKQSYYSGGWHSVDVYHGLAKSLYYNNFRIVNKDSVVVSREEYEKLQSDIKRLVYQNCNLKIENKNLEENLEIEILKSKEMAEKIYKDIRLFLNDKTLEAIKRYFKEVIGIEIKE